MSSVVTTKQLYGLRVVSAVKDKKIGKVHNFVFHPTEKRCIGLLVKRPDAALMFHRKDLFVALDAFVLEDGIIRVSDAEGATDSAACKRLGVKFDECVLWYGMPAMCEDGTSLGYIDCISFDRVTGQVDMVTVETTATAKLLLGKTEIPVSYVRGFRRGMGVRLSTDSQEQDEVPEEDLGTILVSDQVKELSAKGGVAEKAGKATAVATHKVKRVVKKAAPQQQVATEKAAEGIEKGAYVTGRQIERAKGMFGAFADEFKKSLND